MNTKWRRWFGWSKSRVGVFQECPKKYSFQYLFKFEPGRPAAIAKALSKLPNLPMQKGTLIHQEIERFVKATTAHGEASQEASRKRLEASFRTLEARAATGLVEGLFEATPAEELQARVAAEREDAVAQLERFFETIWPRYRGLEVLSCETLERFKVGDHDTWVSADLVVRDAEGEVVLVDWKTGRSQHGADESIQLTAYFLWASEHFETPLEKIRGELVWLSSGEVDVTRRDESRIQELRETMHADCEAMLALDDYAQIEARPDPKQCSRCPFRPLCREADPPLPEDVKARALATIGDQLR